MWKGHFYDIWIYLLLYINTSLYFAEKVGGAASFLLTMFLIMIVVWKSGSIRVNKKQAILAAVLILAIGSSCAVNGWYMEIDFGAVITIFCGVLICSQVEENIFIKHYCRVMRFVTICSFAGIAIYYLLPGILNLFPLEQWHGGILIRNLFITLVPVSMADYFRNWGFFHEPGMFSFYLCLALIWELFVLNTTDKRIILLEITAILTTLSTSGFIAAACVMMAFLFNQKLQKESTRKLRTAICFLFILAVVYFSTAGQQDFKKVYDKFFEMSVSSVNTMQMGSGMERLRAVIKSLELFLSSPIVGIGAVNFSFQGIIMTFTPINWFALYGIFYGIICNFLFFTIPVTFHMNKKAKLFVAAALGVLVSSQSMEITLIMNILLMYRFVNLKKVRFCGFVQGRNKSADDG